MRFTDSGLGMTTVEVVLLVELEPAELLTRTVNPVVAPTVLDVGVNNAPCIVAVTLAALAAAMV